MGHLHFGDVYIFILVLKTGFGRWGSHENHPERDPRHSKGNLKTKENVHAQSEDL